MEINGHGNKRLKKQKWVLWKASDKDGRWKRVPGETEAFEAHRALQEAVGREKMGEYVQLLVKPLQDVADYAAIDEDGNYTYWMRMQPELGVLGAAQGAAVLDDRGFIQNSLYADAFASYCTDTINSMAERIMQDERDPPLTVEDMQVSIYAHLESDPNITEFENVIGVCSFCMGWPVVAGIVAVNMELEQVTGIRRESLQQILSAAVHAFMGRLVLEGVLETLVRNGRLAPEDTAFLKPEE